MGARRVADLLGPGLVVLAWIGAPGCGSGGRVDTGASGVTSGGETGTGGGSSGGGASSSTTGATGADASESGDAGSSGDTSGVAVGPPYVELTLLASQSDPALGAGQGVELRDGRIYAYGDRQGTGVIREYEVIAGDPPALEFSGLEVVLRRDGVDLIPHPTGLTWGPEGTFLGNTVAGVGTIFVIDWPQMLADGDLDVAVLAEVSDDVLSGGTRPERVRVGEVWRLASAGYLDADAGNTLRLFDAAALVGAGSTAEPGVLVATAPIGPWVQSLAYFESLDLLVAAQNLSYGSGWRISVAPLDAEGALGEVQVIEAGLPGGELEGIHPLGDGVHAVLITSGKVDNLWIAALEPLAP